MATAYPFTFLPNWQEPVRIRREYRTSIWRSRSRREQRRALRQTPRLSFSFQLTLNGDTRREFRALMDGALNKPMLVPDWSRSITLAAPAAETASTITVSSALAWLVDGRGLFLYDGQNRPTPIYVDTVVGTTVTLASPLTAAWPAGSQILAGCVGFINGGVSPDAVTNTLSTVSIDFDVQPGTEPAPAPAAAGATFNGLEVCPLTANWRDGYRNALEWSAEFVDNGYGPIAYGFPVDFPTETRRFTVTAGNVAAIATVVDFFDRMAGQRDEFYMPSGEADLIPVAALTGGTATLTVAGTDTATHYADSTVYTAIRVLLNDGTVLYRTVAGIAAAGDNSVLTLGANWPSSITPADVTMISWMPVRRFASDTQTIDLITETVAESDIVTLALETLP